MYVGELQKSHIFLDIVIESRETRLGPKTVQLINPIQMMAQCLRLQCRYAECLLACEGATDLIQSIIVETSKASDLITLRKARLELIFM